MKNSKIKEIQEEIFKNISDEESDDSLEFIGAILKIAETISPEKGIDYFSEGEIQEFKTEILQGATPQIFKDYFTEEQIKQISDTIKEDLVEKVTPIKGVDYFDGAKGKDGKDADETVIVSKVLKQVPKPEEIKPNEIVTKLNTLENVLEAKVIKDLPNLKDFIAQIKDGKLLELRDIKGARLDMNDQRWHGGGIQNITDLIQAGTNITITGTGTDSDPYIINGSASGVTSLNGLTGAVTLAAGTNISLVPVGNTITINATDTDTGITQLTGDVTAGPGSGSQVATLATVNSNVGSFTYASITVNAKGLITAASSGSAPEVPLTFSTGLTRTVNTITANISTGIAGGQTAIGGTASGNNLTLSSTSHATKGKILFGTSAYDEVNNYLGIGTATPASRVDITTNSLGVTQTDTSGLALINTTAATSGTQQISPAVRWRGFGWKTDATAASQAVNFRSYVLPVLGTANPTGTWVLQSSINTAAYTDRMTISSTGEAMLNSAPYTSTGHSGLWIKSNIANAGAGNNGGGIILGAPTSNGVAQTDGAAIFGRQFGSDPDNTGIVFAVRSDSNTSARNEIMTMYYDSAASPTYRFTIGSGTTPSGLFAVGGDITTTAWMRPDLGFYNDFMFVGDVNAIGAWADAYVLLHAVGAIDTDVYNYCKGTLIVQRQTSIQSDAVVKIQTNTTNGGAWTGFIEVLQNDPGTLTVELVECTYGGETYAAIKFSGTMPRNGSWFFGIRNSVGNAVTEITAINGALISGVTVKNSISVNSNLTSVISSFANYNVVKNLNVGLDSAPTARVLLPAGTATANTAPLRFTSGTNLTVAVAGAVEYDGTQLYFSPSTTRNALIQDNGTRLTSGRVPFAGTNGYLQDDSDMTFSGSRLTVTDLTSTNAPIVSSLTAGRVVFAGASKELVDDADFTFVTDTLTVTKIVGTTSVKVGTAAGYISSDGSTGATGTFLSADAKIVTVKDGIITSIV